MRHRCIDESPRRRSKIGIQRRLPPCRLSGLVAFLVAGMGAFAALSPHPTTARAAGDGLVLEFEHGGALSALATDGSWAYLVQGSRVHVVSPSNPGGSPLASSKPDSLSRVKAAVARDGTVALGGDGLRIFHHRGTDLRITDQWLPRHGIEALAWAGDRLWVLGDDGQAHRLRIDEEGTIVRRDRWAPTAPTLETTAQISALAPSPNGELLFALVQWVGETQPFRDPPVRSAEILQIEVTSGTNRVIARAPAQRWPRPGLLAGDTWAMLYARSGFGATPQAQLFTKGPATGLSSQLLRWAGEYGTQSLAMMDDVLWRLDQSGQLYRHARLSAVQSQPVPTPSFTGVSVLGIGARLALLSPEQMWWLEDDGSAAPDVALDTREIAEVAATKHGAWLRRGTRAMDFVPATGPDGWLLPPPHTGPTYVYQLFGAGERVYSLANGVVEIYADRSRDRGRLERLAGLPQAGDHRTSLLMDAEGDRVVTKDSSGTIWLQRSTVDGRPAQELYMLTSGDVIDEHLDGDLLWLAITSRRTTRLEGFDIAGVGITAPRQTSLSLPGSTAISFAVERGIALVGRGPILSALRVSDPSRPKEVDVLDLPGSIVHVTVQGLIAWVYSTGSASDYLSAIQIGHGGSLHDLGTVTLPLGATEIGLAADAGGVWLVADRALQRYTFATPLDSSPTADPRPSSTAPASATPTSTATAPEATATTALPTATRTPTMHRELRVLLPWLARGGASALVRFGTP